MFEDAAIEELRARLLKEGSTVITDQRGRKLYLVHTRLLKLDFDGLLVAYEGHGAYTFDLDRPLNKFRFIQAGFGFDVADILADVVNRVTRVGASPGVKGVSFKKAKALSGPKKEK